MPISVLYRRKLGPVSAPQKLILHNCGTTSGSIEVLKSMAKIDSKGIAFGDQVAVKTAKGALDSMIESEEYRKIAK